MVSFRKTIRPWGGFREIRRGFTRLVCIAAAAGSILSCAGADVANGMSPGTGNDAGPVVPGLSISVADALAELNGLEPAPGVDPELHRQLVDSLRKGLSANSAGRIPVAVPSSPGSRIDDLRIWNGGDGTAVYRFSYRNEGDYNQDSQVTASDITPLGQYYDRHASVADWVRAALADGNSDGRVAVSDITPIGQWYGNSLEGYIVESTTTPADTNSWTEVNRLLFSSGILPAAGGHRQFSHAIPEPTPGTQFRVVPFLAEGTGIAGTACAYTGDSAPAFVVSGTCLDGAGAALTGVEFTLGTAEPVVSGADGSFSFTGLADGFSAVLEPALDGRLFMPEQFIVTINNASATGIQFTGHAATGITCPVPATVDVGQEVTLILQVVDAAGQPVKGFAGNAQLTSSSPGLTVLVPPVFSDGSATATIRFSITGDHTLSVTDLHTKLDGELGSTTVRPLPPPELSAAKWRGNAEAAISLTFDDGTEDHWTRGLPLWEEYGYRVTLGIILRDVVDKPQRIARLQQAFDAGHEIANHTATHPDLTSLTPAQITSELQPCTDFLVSNINGLTRIDTVIYPYEMFNDTVLDKVAEGGYLFARSGYQGISDYAELNNAWSPPLHHLYSWANQDVLPLAMWNSTTDWTVNHGDWLVEQCHGIGTLGEPGVGWSPRPEHEYRAHYDHIKSYGDRVWVAPIREVGCYLVERNNAQFEVLNYTGSQLDFILYDALDNSIFNIPLTIMLDLPAGWDWATASQGLETLPLEIRDGKILFDVRPGSGSVSVRRTG